MQVFIVKPHDFDPSKKYPADSQCSRRSAIATGLMLFEATGKSIRAPVTSWRFPIRTARPAMVRTTPRRFPATGQERSTKI